MLVDPFEPETVYASTLTGLYKTMDGGKAWVRIGQSLQDQMLFSMILDRTKKGVIYLGGREGIHRSEDGGATWVTLNTGLATLNIRSLVQSLTDPDVFYAGTNGSGLYRSHNRGEKWESVPTALSSQ